MGEVVTLSSIVVNYQVYMNIYILLSSFTPIEAILHATNCYVITQSHQRRKSRQILFICKSPWHQNDSVGGQSTFPICGLPRLSHWSYGSLLGRLARTIIFCILLFQRRMKTFQLFPIWWHNVKCPTSRGKWQNNGYKLPSLSQCNI